MPETATPDPRDLKELEDEWRKNPRTPSFYSLASRLFEMGRTQDAHDVLLRGLEVHRSHLEAQKLLAQVLAALDGVRGSRPGEQPLGRVRVKSGVRMVEERVSRKITERHISDGPSKVSRHRPPAEDPFASDPSDEFAQPAATPWPRLTPQSLEIAREKAGGATTLAPRRRMLIAAIVLLVIAAAIAALLIFQPL
jgi:hypothetical protein